MYWISIILIVFSNVGYHLCLKMTPSGIHPLFSLSISYAIALFLCLACIPFFQIGGLREQFAMVGWPTIGLGFSVCLLEVGFLLAYRYQWNLSVASLFCNVAVGILLVPIALTFFKERPSPTQICGIILAVLGLVAMGKK